MNRTPLFDEHVAQGARMVEFGGWEMPVWYAGIPAEHQAVRTAVGLFDVSHMGEFRVEGEGALGYLQRVLTNDVGDLEVGQAQYTLLPNAEGGTVDDLLAYRTAPASYLLVVNAGNIHKDFVWLADQLDPWIEFEDQSSRTALLALQGPRAVALMGELAKVQPERIPYYHFQNATVCGAPAMLSRTGYTGEDGFEIMLAPEDAPDVWRGLLAAGAGHGIRPCGLGARDSLRMEAAMPLYGHELDDETSAIEAGLTRFVKLEKSAMNGLERMRREVAEGVSRRLVGLQLLDRGVPRQGYPILAGDQTIGVVTSGTLSPTLDVPIGMGYVPPRYAKVGTELAVEVRGRAVPAKVVKRPFYKRTDG